MFFLMWFQKQCVNNIVFSAWACAAGFSNNIVIPIKMYLNAGSIVRRLTSIREY